jgi:hypothetical protein
VLRALCCETCIACVVVYAHTMSVVITDPDARAGVSAMSSWLQHEQTQRGALRAVRCGGVTVCHDICVHTAAHCTRAAGARCCTPVRDNASTAPDACGGGRCVRVCRARESVHVRTSHCTLQCLQHAASRPCTSPSALCAASAMWSVRTQSICLVVGESVIVCCACDCT